MPQLRNPAAPYECPQCGSGNLVHYRMTPDENPRPVEPEQPKSWREKGRDLLGHLLVMGLLLWGFHAENLLHGKWLPVMAFWFGSLLFAVLGHVALSGGDPARYAQYQRERYEWENSATCSRCGTASTLSPQ